MTDRLLTEARRSGTPLIEGRRVTFVWDGSEPVRLMGDWTDWEAAPLQLASKPGAVQTVTLEFPLDVYLEYAFLDPSTGERMVDPHNRNRVANGMGGSNSCFSMPERPANLLARRRREVARGRLAKHALATGELVARRRRMVYLYQPVSEVPVPLLVVLDGIDYLRRAALAVIVDNLIAEGRIRPVAMALVHHGGSARIAEYGCSDGTLAFLERRVLALAEQELNLAPAPHGILGASMGGMMGLCAAVRRPDLFDKVLSQSGAFILDGFEMAAFDVVRHHPVAPVQIWMDVGRFERFLDASRRMHALLVERGYPVGYSEYQAGHCFTAWRDDVWRGLEALYPPS